MKKPIKKIVAIGGGEIGKIPGTYAIDKEIVRLTQKQHPKLLFIPTASSDNVSYWKRINSYFSKKLECKTDVLFLLKETLTFQQIKEKILGADIIYVGGGNTLKMMKLWRKIGVDKLLKTAWEKGIVLSGISAGSICWFDSGHSDSMSFYSPKKWSYIKVRGLSFLQGVHCPHYNSSTLGIPRKNHFKKMIQKMNFTGIAIDNNCAIEFLDNQYRVISSKKHAKAFKVFKKNNQVVSECIPQGKKPAAIANLFGK